LITGVCSRKSPCVYIDRGLFRDILLYGTSDDFYDPYEKTAPAGENNEENNCTVIDYSRAPESFKIKRGRLPENENFKFITFGGDGGTYDIGFQSLSGAMERGHDMVYVCYDNGAYMNTGIQRSSATPMFADTTTTPAGKCSDGKIQYRKDLTAIIAEHHVPYAAQTTLTKDFKDLHRKAAKAIYTEGPAFLNMMTPCPRGWRYETSQIMEICRLAVETCYWPLFEVDHGKWSLSYEPKNKLPIEDFLRPQGRFKHLFKPGNEHLLALFQEEVDRRWEDLQYLCAR
jgi:pyruvate ferredoxin oxidoreductase beta subunit